MPSFPSFPRENRSSKNVWENTPEVPDILLPDIRGLLRNSRDIFCPVPFPLSPFDFHPLLPSPLARTASRRGASYVAHLQDDAAAQSLASSGHLILGSTQRLKIILATPTPHICKKTCTWLSAHVSHSFLFLLTLPGYVIHFVSLTYGMRIVDTAVMK